MKTRKLKISFNKSGSGSISASVRLPISWLKELGLTQENREVSVNFDNNKIIIEKEGNDMLNKLKNELLNERFTLSEFDDFMVRNDFFSIFNDGVVDEVLEDGNIAYDSFVHEGILISFDVIEQKKEESLIKITDIENI